MLSLRRQAPRSHQRCRGQEACPAAPSRVVVVSCMPSRTRRRISNADRSAPGGFYVPSFPTKSAPLQAAHHSRHPQVLLVAVPITHLACAVCPVSLSLLLAVGCSPHPPRLVDFRACAPTRQPTSAFLRESGGILDFPPAQARSLFQACCALSSALLAALPSSRSHLTSILHKTAASRTSLSGTTHNGAAEISVRVAPSPR